MKKNGFFAFLLALLLSLLCLMQPVAATQEQTTQPPETTAAPTAEGETAAPTAEGETTVPEVQPPVSYIGVPTVAGNLLDYGFPTDFELKAKAGALIELGTGTLLYGYELDRQIYPASLTKIMTCMLALEYGNLDEVVTASDSALSGLSEYGSSVGLVSGEQMTLHELLYCIMVSSANEGCNVVAEHVAGDVDSFVTRMNAKATELGMTSTKYRNTHGLHNDEHYTTVRDLSILVRWAWENETFRALACCTEHTVPATNKSESRLLETTNYLTSNKVREKYYYEKASGVKTGFTTPAGGCLISTATDGDMQLLSIVVGCETATAFDGSEEDQRFTESKRLFEYGFDTFSYRQVFNRTAGIDQPRVSNAAGRNSVFVRAQTDASVVLPNALEPTDVELRPSYDGGELDAPLVEGQRVGTVTAYYRGKTLVSCDLVTLTAVERAKTAPTADASAQAQRANKSDGGFPVWLILIPVILVAVLLVVLRCVRARNIRLAKKKEQERRRREARRYRDV